MNDILKQRLVGALVLIALGVVFWPVIFVESERKPLELESRIPTMPVLDRSRIEPPQEVPGVAPAESREISLHKELPEAIGAIEKAPDDDSPVNPAPVEAETAQQSAAPKPLPKAKPGLKPQPAPTAPSGQNKPALDQQGIPIAWVLQVVSVSKKEKADALTAQLIERGYKAYHRTIRRDDETLYRVFVGPVFERSQLASIKREVDRELRVNAIISRYLP